MKFQGKEQGNLHTQIKDQVQAYRRERNFDAKQYVEEKIELIGSYFSHYKLDTAVIGVSGGIDSAICLALLDRVKNSQKSSLSRIMPLLLPALSKTKNSHEGATSQDEATSRGSELCHTFGLPANTYSSLSQTVETIAQDLEKMFGYQPQGWGRGQLVAYARTPVLYYAATLSTENRHPALVVGTTNFDEGGYLGYIGKASDGMVDLQIISDLHKSEVYQVAKYLNIPQSIIDVTPSGDMFDGRVDEEVFGASYDFVELYLSYLRKSSDDQNIILESFDEDARRQFTALANNLEELHSYNHHKYLGRSPAVHLDILPCRIQKGWNNPTWEKGEMK